MKKHYSYKKISSVGKKIIKILSENESSGLSTREILEKVKEDKDIALTALNELLNYNACVVFKKDKFFYEV